MQKMQSALQQESPGRSQRLLTTKSTDLNFKISLDPSYGDWRVDDYDRVTAAHREWVASLPRSRDNNHWLVAEYDFNGTDEEAERWHEDVEDVEIVCYVEHPPACWASSPDPNGYDCPMDWLIGEIGLEDALGDVVLCSPGRWVATFHSEGGGEDLHQWIQIAEDTYER